MAQEYTGFNDEDTQEWDKIQKAHEEASKLQQAKETTDCRSEEGITVGLVDSLITVSRILKHRLTVLQITPAINEAIKDFQLDEDIKFILNIKTD